MKRQLDYFFGIPLLQLLARLPFIQTSRVAAPKTSKVLIIKLAAFGDAVVLVPALRALRAALPDAQIDWLDTPVNHAMAARVPYVNQTRTLKSFHPLALWTLARQLRAERYDAVIDLEQWSRGSALLAWYTGAPIRLGFEVKGQHRRAGFTHTLLKRFQQHERDDFWDLISMMTPLSGVRDLEMWETPAGIKEAESLAPEFSAGGTIVILHPGCGHDGLPREWPLSFYAHVAKGLAAKRPIRCIITGGRDDAAKAAALAAHLPGSECLAGRLSWDATISLIRRATLVISGNTGVMHIAAAWNIPQIALHGPTDVRLWGPINPNATVISSRCPECPCLKLGFEYHTRNGSCMAQITEAEVLDAALRRLN